jgi:hypothetical protein
MDGRFSGHCLQFKGASLLISDVVTCAGDSFMLFQKHVQSVFSACLSVLVISSAGLAGEPRSLPWKQHIINDQSPYEACGTADFNGDGRIDIFCGDSWYEAPSWTRHKVRDVPASGPNPHYHEDFADSPLDVNGDGRPDIVTCNYFGKRVGWVQNPGGPATAAWQEHEIDLPGNMETGEMVNLVGDAQPEFLPNVGSTVVFYELTSRNPVQWTRRDLGAEGAGHGVGAGDLNSDGRNDVITPKGWYEQLADGGWSFHAEFALGAAGIMILGYDVDGDQLQDVLYGNGHGFGLYWLRQTKQPDGSRQWQKQTIDDTFSQVHTLVLAQLDGEGEPELVTGKRVYAHESEAGATDGSVVFYFQYDRKAGTWQKHTVFQGDPAVNAPENAKDRWALKDFPKGSAGTGLQMSVVDIDADGDLDLVCPGKSGLYLFENLRQQKR